jgi:hypothetical protein
VSPINRRKFCNDRRYLICDKEETSKVNIIKRSAISPNLSIKTLMGLMPKVPLMNMPTQRRLGKINSIKIAGLVLLISFVESIYLIKNI